MKKLIAISAAVLMTASFTATSASAKKMHRGYKAHHSHHHYSHGRSYHRGPAYGANGMMVRGGGSYGGGYGGGGYGGGSYGGEPPPGGQKGKFRAGAQFLGHIQRGQICGGEEKPRGNPFWGGWFSKCDKAPYIG